MTFKDLSERIRVLHRRIVSIRADLTETTQLANLNNDELWLLDADLHSPRRPFAVAAGTVLSAANAGNSGGIYWDNGVTVMLPAGRFTVPPIIVATAERSAQVLSANILSRTATSFTVRTIRFGAAVTTGTVVHWHAIQMTEGSANG